MKKTNYLCSQTRFLKLLLSFLVLFSFATTAFSQINIKQSGGTFRDVIELIKSQTDYQFFYESNIGDIKIDNINMSNATLDAVLSAVLSKKNITYRVEDKVVYLSTGNTTGTKQKSEKRMIKGNISDADNTPLIGVSIGIKGTSTGTTTDLEGNYSIQAQDGERIEITYVGFNSIEFVVKGDMNQNITLKEDDVTLREVVVTALGIRRETKALTYNVQELKGSEITAVKDANFINSLAGKVAGMQISSSASGIGGSARVIMRGTKSILGNNNALYVVDGIPLYDVRSMQPENIYESRDGGDSDGFSNINSEDIETISVLSGPAASALYGSNGANGVILITTKKGEEGKVKVSYSNSSIFLKPFVMPKFQNTYGSHDQSFQSWGPKLTTPTSYDPKDFFQTGYVESNALSVSFGTEKSQTYASLATTNSRGIIPNNKLNRYNVSFRNSSELIKDKLTLDASFSYVREDNRNMMTQGQYHNPLVPIYLFPRGDDIENYKVYERYNPARNFATQYWPSKYGNQGLGIENPYWTVNRKLFENERDRNILSGALSYKPLKWLNIMGRARMDNMENTFERKIYASSDKLFASETGNYMNQRTSHKQLYLDALVNVDKRFGDFGLTGTVGTSYFEYQYALNSYEGHLLMVPNRFTQSNINKDHPESKVNQEGYKDNTHAVFATAQVGWKSLVFLDMTVRNDWASTLQGTNSTGIFYPSVGVSGILSDMFDISKAQISFWKMRFSYSEVGNPPPRHVTKAVYELDNGRLGKTNLPFSHLKAERTKAYEVGTNFKFLKNKVNLDLTYYTSDTYNQLFEFEAAASSIYNKYYVNAGKVNNWGIEASVGYTDSYGPVKFNTSFTFTMNRNKIKVLIPEGTIDPLTGSPMMAVDGISMSNTGTYRMDLREGGTLGDIYVSTLQRDSHGNIKVDPSTGAIAADPNNWIKAGSVSPRFNYGWSNTISYKGFDFNFLIDARIGGIGVSPTQAMLDRHGVSKTTADARDNGGVNINGGKIDAEAYYTIVAGGTTGILSEYVYSMTNVRLREASLAYTFPSHLFKDKIGSLSVSLIGRNLFMFHNRAPFDPEITASTGTYFQGIDYFMQPSLRNIGFGVRLQF